MPPRGVSSPTELSALPAELWQLVFSKLPQADRCVALAREAWVLFPFLRRRPVQPTRMPVLSTTHTPPCAGWRRAVCAGPGAPPPWSWRSGRRWSCGWRRATIWIGGWKPFSPS